MKSDTVLCDSKTCSKTQGVVGCLCACERMLGSEVVLGFSPTSQVVSRGRKIKPGSKMIEFKTKMLSRQPETPGGQVFVYSTL